MNPESITPDSMHRSARPQRENPKLPVSCNNRRGEAVLVQLCSSGASLLPFHAKIGSRLAQAACCGMDFLSDGQACLLCGRRDEDGGVSADVSRRKRIGADLRIVVGGAVIGHG